MNSERILATLTDRRSRNARSGFSLIELLIVIAIILVILTIAVPTYSSIVRKERENAAAEDIRAIQQAQVQYYSDYNRFAASLQELGPPASGPDGPSGAGLIQRDLASGDKGGYKFAIQITPTGYGVTAVPTQYGTSGSRTFFSDQTLGIHQHAGQEPATVNDPLLGETAAATQTQSAPSK